MAWLTVPAKYGASVHDADYFRITKHLYGSICKFIVFVVLQSHFRHGSLRLNHRTALHIRVGLAQARPKKLTS